MSLTSFLKDDKELRVVIDHNFEKPEFEAQFARRAEPQTSNYALIGTAFDYVLRFWLEGQYEVSSKPWVAHQGRSIANTYPTDAHDLADDVDLNQVFREVETLHEEFLETGEMSDDLLAGTLDLAHFDWVYRSGRPLSGLTQAEEGDIEDLRQLYEIIPTEEFSGLDEVLLNPTFGDASVLVNGADADLVLDGTLLDIKTVKAASLKIGYWRQLVGYATLADIADTGVANLEKFDRVGIYFSRHGRSWTTSADQIYENEQYEQFKSWFQERAREHFSG